MKRLRHLVLYILSLVFLLAFPCFSSSIAHANVSITEFSGNSVGENDSLTAGPDGNLWFTEMSADLIAKITPEGVVTEFPLPLAVGVNWPASITSGPDGNLWFTTLASRRIEKIATDGTITIMNMNGSGSGCTGPNKITSGPDGNLWFTTSCETIGKITTSGTVTEFPIPSGTNGKDITSGPDGNLWFTETDVDRIAKITTSGTVTEFPLPVNCHSLPSGCQPQGITSGPDGNLWFTEIQAGKIGRITPSGTLTEFSIPSNPQPTNITTGSDGNLWFTEFGITGGNNVGQITPNGTIAEFPSPSYGSVSIVHGPDNNLWYIEGATAKIAKVNVTANSTPTPTPSPIVGRQIVFVHGLNSSYIDVQAGKKEFSSLISSIPTQNEKIFQYYQDSGYKNDSGSCTDQNGNPQPTPDTNNTSADLSTGLLFGHPESINANKCDSQSAVAYSATGLDDFLSSLSSPVALIDYSMGAPIVRGWLTLAQNKQSDQTLNKVDTIISVHGAQKGTWVAAPDVELSNSQSWSAPIWADLKTIVQLFGEINYNVSRPAIADLTPNSFWYIKANTTNVPTNMHYYNFYSNIRLNPVPTFLFHPLKPLSKVPLGDTVLLPGTSNPTDLSPEGGARFLPGGVQTTDRHEYELQSDYDVYLSEIYNEVFLSPGTALRTALGAILQAPTSHINLTFHNLNNNNVLISSCKSSQGMVTVQTEILRILNDPAHACD